MSTPERVEFALDAMTTEAENWGDRRAALEGALRAIEGLRLSTAEFSWITEGAGTLDAYLQAEDRMRRLVEQGVDVFQDMQDRLVSARDQYAADEEANVHAASGIY